jgi:hypothetical protein
VPMGNAGLIWDGPDVRLEKSPWRGFSP